VAKDSVTESYAPFFPPSSTTNDIDRCPQTDPTPNFISEVFYLTAAMYHLHFRPVELYLKRIASDSRNYRERIEAVENDPSWRSVSPHPVLSDLTIYAPWV
jgi:hypothetical protein